LKRDLGGDRREELYVPRSVLASRFADLPAAQRRAFEMIGLGEGDGFAGRGRERGPRTTVEVANDQEAAIGVAAEGVEGVEALKAALMRTDEDLDGAGDGEDAETAGGTLPRMTRQRSG
jgi:hypothetical protein